MPEIRIEIAAPKNTDGIDSDLLRCGIERVLAMEGIPAAEISLAIVDDAEIHRINCEFLGHDYATDVISFLLSAPELDPDDEYVAVSEVEAAPASHEKNGDAVAELAKEEPDEISHAGRLQGELIVSLETAIREAHVHGWSPQAELLLYVVHGMLHLCGYDDLTDEARPLMRMKEREILATWGFCPTGLEL